MKKTNLTISATFLFVACASLLGASLQAQSVTLPPSGGNQRASVSQWMGLVRLTIDYHSPDVTAFELHAVDYLLKPFSDQRFFQALRQAKERIRASQQQETQARLLDLLTHYQHQLSSSAPSGLLQADQHLSQRLPIKHQGKIVFLHPADIIWLEAADYYLKIHTSDGSYLVRESLKHMEQKLSRHAFLRVHKSSMVNRNHLKEMEPFFNGDYVLHLTNGTTLKVGRTYRQALMEALTL